MKLWYLKDSYNRCHVLKTGVTDTDFDSEFFSVVTDKRFKEELFCPLRVLEFSVVVTRVDTRW